MALIEPYRDHLAASLRYLFPSQKWENGFADKTNLTWHLSMT